MPEPKQQPKQKIKRNSILKRYAVLSLVALVIAAGVSLLLSSLINYSDVMDEAKKIVALEADELEMVLESSTYEELVSGPNTQAYEDIREACQTLTAMFNVSYAFVYEQNDDGKGFTLRCAVAGDADADALLRENVKIGEDNMVHGAQGEKDALKGKVSIEPEVTRGAFGTSLTWYYPIIMPGTDKVLILRIDIDDQAVMGEIYEHTLAFAIPMIVINAIMVLLGVFALKKSVSDPLNVLSTRMRGYVKDHTSDAEPLKIGRDDEISDIADSYNKMNGDIRQYVSEIETMTQERVAASTELAVAQRIQQGLVPPTTELTGEGFEAFAFMRMARAVGGDFYQLAQLDDGRVMLMLADVSGKGVSAALFMAMCLTLLYERLEACKDPAEALNGANDMIVGNNPENMFVTLVAGIFDPKTGVLTYANAGHTPPYVVGRGYEDPDSGIALGLFADAGIVNEAVRLAPGEGVLFYTDGATEANDKDGQFFGEKRLAAAVDGTTRPEDAIGAAVDAIDRFVADNEQFDDLTLLSLFYRKTSGAIAETIWHDKLEPKPTSFIAIRQQVLDCFATKAEGMNAVLACDETFTNIVAYSGATVVEVWIERDEREVRIRFSDDGTPFDPLTVDLAERDFDDLDMGGMGISLVKQAVSDIDYEHAGGRNVLTLHFAL